MILSKKGPLIKSSSTIDHTIIDATSDRNIEWRKERQFWIAKKAHKMIYFLPKFPFSPYRMTFSWKLSKIVPSFRIHTAHTLIHSYTHTLIHSYTSIAPLKPLAYCAALYTAQVWGKGTGRYTERTSPYSSPLVYSLAYLAILCSVVVL